MSKNKERDLLVKLLEEIAKITDVVNIYNEGDGKLYNPQNWCDPEFEFTEEDMEVIEDLAKGNNNIKELFECTQINFDDDSFQDFKDFKSTSKNAEEF